MSSVPRVSWETAATTAVRLVPPGPTLPVTEAAAVVAGLREASERAQAYVRDLTRMDPPGERPTLVVDRASWIRGNLDSFAGVLDDLHRPATGRLATSALGRGVRAVRDGSTGAMVGGVLAVLAPRVLGQFDVFHGLGGSTDHGRLLLVAPNIHGIGHKLGLDPADFRLWVCLHEETHRVQYQRAPWLADHLAGLVRTAMSGSDREVDAATDGITAVMSVVEGHADVVMDQVGPGVIPTLRSIRARFDKRREGRPGLARIIGKLLGMESKMQQYREGAAFCRAVQAEIGVDGFNRVFEAPGELPDLHELRHPHAWVERTGLS
ncbi:putative hydrolase/uncharacterized protein, coenzyme F420 biosynthesis associated [Raineyella antarctica]|uniref:Putative hydrolase/uncharacterized protein, coenzyme F420 biosynthesis associated n=1 Tax=Raineyella antarctica TaxID=1577474 RepID=A0A1G6IJ63_9ACTN|nr:zinc-dependent metalloprotease [Raineyella antarctica]SDC06463.1 putative hydrolase/uncharacterized protein, coenzyme F420 biosynthesis associated [Raineyella antarctica]